MRTPPRVLVIDDDPSFWAIAEFMLRQIGCESSWLDHADIAEIARVQPPPDVILLDRQLGTEDAQPLIRPLADAVPGAAVVLVTASAGVDAAQAAIDAGAVDFLAKPLDEARLLATVNHASQQSRLARQALAADDNPDTDFEGMVGTSDAMQTVFRTIEHVGPTDASVMIVGESGTGKELIARAIHRRSPRRDGPFIALNMGALPRELVESTLFGHERGAFTGADRQRLGAVEDAQGGTLFLDEIGEMPLDTQPKLLRFLQERTFRRVGGNTELVADVRIVSATNREPTGDTRSGRLRQDLYYRLSVVPIRLVPLRERSADIPLLARRFLREAAERHNKDFRDATPQALDRLKLGRWKGNVRQLRHLVERIVVMNDGPVLTPGMIPATPDASDAIQPSDAASVAESVRSPVEAATDKADILPLEEVERVAIERALKLCDGSISEAARRLGIHRNTMANKIRRYNLSV
ncbi:MAG: sigma-54 dependent transcriptional regulator [Planctomycetota bacterium]